ncbi:MAG: 50S ribosomal protein L4 [Candidatus Omnitrophica bacterium]|nr:50S ribosomal protein L4 [Candidatus Omnitrophota bacterium]MBU1523684.1 50S ribosomal protein L4 [Candidatus Omnitrophota bacterium]MBU2436433.1 50S ribosomal protein L4 [Candidatus Omnitrophota bacterium]
MDKINVLNMQGKEVDKIELNPVIFDGKINQALLHQAVVAYLSNQRKGLACTKTRGEVRGGGKKPWRQKGTGRARVGSIRSPLWRGGGVTFGPKSHSYHKDLPKKMKVLALKSALNAKLKDKEMVILDSLNVNFPKTKEFFKIVKNLNFKEKRIKFVAEKLESNLKLACRNIEKVEIKEAETLTTYEALDCKKLIFTKDALRKVEERIEKGLKTKIGT